MNLRLATHVGGRANNSPLTPLGVAQATAVGVRVKRMLAGAPTTIHASPAVRAMHTAAAIADACGLPGPMVSDRLLEIDMGEWSGQPRGECYTPTALASIAANPTGFAPPGGESQATVEARMVAHVTECVLPTAVPGGPPAIVVGHGLAIKTLLRAVTGADAASFAARNFALDNTGIVEVAWDGGAVAEGRVRDAWHVLRVNDAAHLEGVAV